MSNYPGNNQNNYNGNDKDQNKYNGGSNPYGCVGKNCNGQDNNNYKVEKASLTTK